VNRSSKSLKIQRTAALASVALLLSACGVLEEDKINYKGAAKPTTLEVPPDLTQLRRDSRYAWKAPPHQPWAFKVLRPKSLMQALPPMLWAM